MEHIESFMNNYCYKLLMRFAEIKAELQQAAYGKECPGRIGFQLFFYLLSMLNSLDA